MPLNPPFRVGPFRGIITGSGVPNDDPPQIFDEGEEGAWWLGAQASPKLVAAAAAGIAIAAASAVFTVDEQIAYPPPLGAEASAPGTFAARADHKSTLFQWAFTEELPTPAALEESEWSPAQSVIAKALAAVFSAEDEVAPKVDEDYWWSYPAIAGKVIGPAASAEDELPVTQVEEESWIQPYLVRPSITLAFQADDDVVPTQQAVVDEVYEWTQPYTVRPTVAVLSSDNDETFQQPAALTVDEVYAWAYTPELAKPKVTVWTVEDERLAQLFVDEVYVWEYRAPIPRPTVTVWNALQDEVFVVAVPVESDWQVWVPEYGRPIATLFKDEQIALSGWVAAPVFGWGARGRIGIDSARDPWSRIGTDTAVDENSAIGTDQARGVGGRIGSDNA